MKKQTKKNEEKKFIFSEVKTDLIKEMEEIKSEAVSKKGKSEIEIFISSQINFIDELCEKKVSLSDIYERLEKKFFLGVSKVRFLALVREERKRIGSPFYVPRKPYKKKTAVQAVKAEGVGGFVCAECEKIATRWESKKLPGNFYWGCSACKTLYADNDGKLTNKKL